ncbi:MAG TPA: hypothetical protein PLN06_02065 [Bacteroidales bacterium]|nr:hypothetical protein [Bacteroidales bacterium]HOU95394.1 hypothetical protein [Bacteroidales bacterium]HQG36327.1 hypothetical protein [Bacteroidales bacterium]HQG52489.1 hypothetical protein [Bacteroidales bacterium]HQJ20040.1 hypothetical protein [Bacteroidales bacterium]
MSVQGYEELKNLNSRINELIQRYINLEQENKKLKTLNKEYERLLQEHEVEIKELEKKYERLKLTGVLLGEGEMRQEAKKKITELVREIDKCIALLER